MRILNPYKLMFLFWVIPFFAVAQNIRTYTIIGLVNNGEKLKPLGLNIIDSSGRSIKTILTDITGDFKASGLSAGRYHLINQYYKIDTTFSIPAQSSSPLLIDVNVCDVGNSMAEEEIKQGKPRLLLIGSIAPVYVRGQDKFEKKFNVNYYDFGCSPPSLPCVIDYNKAIFKYLDNKYGDAWRKEVRKDVIGLK